MPQLGLRQLCGEFGARQMDSVGRFLEQAIAPVYCPYFICPTPNDQNLGRTGQKAAATGCVQAFSPLSPRHMSGLLFAPERVKVLLSVLTTRFWQLLDDQRVGRLARVGGHLLFDRLGHEAADIRPVRLAHDDRGAFARLRPYAGIAEPHVVLLVGAWAKTSSRSHAVATFFAKLITAHASALAILASFALARLTAHRVLGHLQLVHCRVEHLPLGHLLLHLLHLLHHLIHRRGGTFGIALLHALLAFSHFLSELIHLVRLLLLLLHLI